MTIAIGEEELARGKKKDADQFEDPRELSSRDVWVHIPCRLICELLLPWNK